MTSPAEPAPIEAQAAGPAPHAACLLQHAAPSASSVHSGAPKKQSLSHSHPAPQQILFSGRASPWEGERVGLGGGGSLRPDRPDGPDKPRPPHRPGEAGGGGGHTEMAILTNTTQDKGHFIADQLCGSEKRSDSWMDAVKPCLSQRTNGEAARLASPRAAGGLALDRGPRWVCGARASLTARPAHHWPGHAFGAPTRV